MFDALDRRIGEGKRDTREKGTDEGKRDISDLRVTRCRDDREATSRNRLRLGPCGFLCSGRERFATLVRKDHRIMCSISGPENEDRRARELATSDRDGFRLVSVRHGPVARVTTYVWAIDDGSPGAELDRLDEGVDVPIASLDCTAIRSECVHA
jgi:hypothetical protein